MLLVRGLSVRSGYFLHAALGAVDQPSVGVTMSNTTILVRGSCDAFRFSW